MSESANEEQIRQSKHKLLHERGVILDDETIDYIIGTLDRGIHMARAYLGRFDDTGLHFISSDNMERIGYSPEKKAINIPVAYFNRLAKRAIPLRLLPKSIRLLPKSKQGIGIGSFHEHVAYEEYLLAAGIEETIHHFQHIGDSQLQAKMPLGSDYEGLDEETKVLSPHEVEARRMTDKILESNHQKPMWEDYDQYLRQAFPNRYERPI